MARLDLEWLRVLVAICDTHSVTLAAERLGMAQASASVALGKLRRHFGDPLFHPRIHQSPDIRSYLAERHIVIASPGMGHAVIARAFARHGHERHIALSVSSFLAAASVVASSELLLIAPSRLGDIVATREPLRTLQPPIALPPYSVRQFWHERFHRDPATQWLRRTLAGMFRAGAFRAGP